MPTIPICIVWCIIHNFIWERKTKNKIQNTLIKNIEQCGLKLCHYPTKVKALTISWIKRFCNISDSNWINLPKYFLNCKDLNLFFSANHKLFTKEKMPNFYIDKHNLYMSNFKKEPITTHDILEQSLWLNKYIEINNETVHWRSWIMQESYTLMTLYIMEHF